MHLRWAIAISGAIFKRISARKVSTIGRSATKGSTGGRNYRSFTRFGWNIFIQYFAAVRLYVVRGSEIAPIPITVKSAPLYGRFASVIATTAISRSRTSGFYRCCRRQGCCGWKCRCCHGC